MQYSFVEQHVGLGAERASKLQRYCNKKLVISLDMISQDTEINVRSAFSAFKETMCLVACRVTAAGHMSACVQSSCFWTVEVSPRLAR